MQERRKKGLCYFYEDKWHQGHRCTKPKIYLLEGMDILDDGFVENQEKEVSDEEAVQFGDIAAISLQAIEGSLNPKTMRIVGQINKKKEVILIETIVPTILWILQLQKDVDWQLINTSSFKFEWLMVILFKVCG